VPTASETPSLEDVFRVMSAAAQGDVHARVELPSQPDIDDPATKIAIGLNLLLDDLSYRAKERQSYEERLRQAQKMEAIGTFAGGIAHDFNNMLSVILGYTELAIVALAPGDPVRADLEEVREAGTRARQLTSQLLTFSRRQVLEPKVHDLGRVLAGMSSMLTRLLGERIELSITAAPDLGYIKADRGHLEQVVMNLSVNARDGMPHGGKLTIELANAALDAARVVDQPGVVPGDFVRLSVTDTGVGIDPSVRDRIFEPFFTTKERTGGTGLGLATVFGIVRQSGGFIAVQSALGSGTTFDVYFPRTLGAPEEPGARAGAPESPRGAETILLVEDMDQVRGVTRAILERSGYVVLEARNGDEALELVGRYSARIDLLLSDVVMPRMTGPELAERLGPVRPELKLIFMSGYAEHTGHDGLRPGGVDFLQKPIAPDALLARVRQVLDRA
jgi:two-component system cell cycle sensor histidine kinase/response regulator CckA